MESAYLSSLIRCNVETETVEKVDIRAFAHARCEVGVM